MIATPKALMTPIIANQICALLSDTGFVESAMISPPVDG
jgi:hypothetical protein